MHSHDSFGLGHLRRTLTLAEALVGRTLGSSVLITTGSPCATHFEVPAGVELVKLPAVTKNEAGECTARTLGSLELVAHLRQRILLEVFEAFEPELLIVDHTASGPGQELGTALDLLRREQPHVRIVLRLRDDVRGDPFRASAAGERRSAFLNQGQRECTRERRRLKLSQTSDSTSAPAPSKRTPSACTTVSVRWPVLLVFTSRCCRM